jgi:hypothetical protein
MSLISVLFFYTGSKKSTKKLSAIQNTLPCRNCTVPRSWHPRGVKENVSNLKYEKEAKFVI